jgi:hypothetical protein
MLKANLLKYAGSTASAVLTAVVLMFGAGCQRSATTPEIIPFEHVIVDQNGPASPWGKSVGDINGDGRPDLIAGGRENGGLVWYENPGWRKHVIASEGAFSTDHEVGDINKDGRNDVISVMYDRLVWFRNEGDDRWSMKEIDQQAFHDVEVADIDGDGFLDIVARGQSAFKNVGGKLYLYLQRAHGGWDKRVIEVPQGEGLKVQDIDGDGKADIIINGVWLKNPGGRNAEWQQQAFTHSWTWPHVYVAVGDVNGDGRLDIVMSPAEIAGGRYRISWFEAPRDRTTEWVEHVVDADVEAVHHFVGVADFDQDGRMDIAAAMMHQGKAPTEVKIYVNQDAGRTWFKQVLSTKGSHNMRIVDIDGDGDPDLFGANWEGENQHPELWINMTCKPGVGCPCWRRHVIDGNRPGKAVFISAADLDGDGHIDLAGGAWWYKNPGTPTGSWERIAFGKPAFDVVLLADLDGDGDIDALATRWREDKYDSRFVFAENDGHGHFRLRDDLPAGAGDFLQGVALSHFGTDGRLQVALSWHRPQDEADRGIQLLTVPKHPAVEPWRLEKISPESQDEALSAGDIDRDGHIDLLLGTRWMRNEGGSWSIHKIDPERADPPDRNRLADINGDGRLDAVVGFRAISKPGDVVWYEQGANPRVPWKQHLVGRVIGPMSLDVVDIDGDGDLDIVVGEHNLKNPDSARLLVFENLDGHGARWRERLIYTGDEHHDGAVASDIDGDGDLDVVSVGWGHGKVLWYENLGPRCTANQGVTVHDQRKPQVNTGAITLMMHLFEHRTINSQAMLHRPPVSQS